MKRYLLLLPCLLWHLSLLGQTSGTSGPLVEWFSIERTGDSVSVSILFDISSIEVKGATTLVLTPSLETDGWSLKLPSLELMGKSRYIYHQRNSASHETMARLRVNGTVQQVSYAVSFPYEDWMDGATLCLADSRKRCCRTVLTGEARYLADSHLGLLPTEPSKTEVASTESEVRFVPLYAWILPDVTRESMAKIRSISGSANVGFDVNRWEIREQYGNNMEELDKIRRSIDSVRYGQDIELKAVYLKGHASPESPWTNNARLAASRTRSLKEYICEKYDLPANIIYTDYEPEDWAGLRRFVEQSYLEHRSEILELIDGAMEPDRKEDILRHRYPDDYRILQRECYPLLRHTDYRIDYQVKSYTDINELRRIFEERPGNLSLDEFQLIASTCEVGSEAFCRVYLKANLYYPEDKATGINAANAALLAGDFGKAEAILREIEAPEADNARGIIAWISGDCQKASDYFIAASGAGCPAAAANAISIINTIIKK